MVQNVPEGGNEWRGPEAGTCCIFKEQKVVIVLEQPGGGGVGPAVTPTPASASALSEQWGLWSEVGFSPEISVERPERFSLSLLLAEGKDPAWSLSRSIPAGLSVPPCNFL